MEIFPNKYSFPQIKCIIFDLDNTLIETRKADARVCDQIASDIRIKYNLSHEEAMSISTNFLSNFRKCPESTRMSLDKWRTYLWSQALGEKYRQHAESIYEKWLYQRYQNLTVPQETMFLLEGLRQKYRVALITNGTSAAQWEKIDRLDLRDYFDLILVSGDLSYEKPDKNIFLQACDYLNVHPKNCLMVGDKLETDIQGGLEAGLAGTVWIPLNKSYILADSDPQPDFILTNVMELQMLLSDPQLFEAKLIQLKSLPQRRARDTLLKNVHPFSVYGNQSTRPSGTSRSDDDKKKSKYMQFYNVFHPEEDSNSNASDGS